jgi:protein-S-isoprenylcysteine O-methyltransferase Ste14
MMVLPPPIWAIVFLAALYFLSNLPGLEHLPSWRNELVGIVLVAIGLLGPIFGVATFRRAGTQVSPTSKTNDRLVTSGPYAVTRNPMYLGLVIVCLGVALWFGRPLMFLAPVLLFTLTNWIFIPFEEAKMRRQYGADFDAYAARVRRWI